MKKNSISVNRSKEPKMTNCVWKTSKCYYEENELNLISRFNPTGHNSSAQRRPQIKHIYRFFSLCKTSVNSTQRCLVLGPIVRCFDSLIASHVCHLSERAERRVRIITWSVPESYELGRSLESVWKRQVFLGTFHCGCNGGHQNWSS